MEYYLVGSGSDRCQAGKFTIIPRYIHSGSPQSPQEFHSVIHSLL